MKICNNELTIRDATINDAEILTTWWNDGKVMAHAGYPLGLKTNKDVVQKQISDKSDNHKRLIIEYINQPIGEMSYSIMGNIGEIGIKICDFSKQEKGYGTILLKMLIKYLFNEKRVNKIILDTNLNNLRAQHVYEKIGFTKLRINYESWIDQLGCKQSSVDYEMTYDKYKKIFEEII